MVTQMLRDCGLDVGREEELMPPTSDNPRGYWEHMGFVEINKEVLECVRGAWDSPPRVPVPTWPRIEALAPVRERARQLIGRFQGRPHWGWKDPRNTFTLPFWLDLMPDLKIVVCLRHPLEVHRSLQVRRHSPHARGLRLWRVFNEFILAHTRAEQRIVTTMRVTFVTPIGMSRVAVHRHAARAVRHVLPAIAGELRHQVHSDAHAKRVRMPPAIMALCRS